MPASSATELGTPRPCFTAAEAAAIASRLYAIDGAAVELGSERDQAFRIDDGAGDAIGILKISNAKQSRAELAFEFELLAHIHEVDPGLPIPEQLPLAARSGLLDGVCEDAPAGARESTPDAAPSAALAAYTGVADSQGARHLLRMMRPLQGRPQATGASLTDRSARHLGETVARLARALQGFFHPAAGRRPLWDIGQAATVRPLLDCIPDPRRATLAARAIERFCEEALPRWPSLRSQVVHGDLNIENVLFDEHGEVSAVLDFGDSLHGPLLGDVASALSSVMRDLSAAGAFRIGRIFLDGYAAIVPLQPAEKALLGVTLRARVATLATLGTWKSQAQPENAAYFQALIRDSWQTLEQLEEAGDAGVDRALGLACAHRPAAALRQKRRQMFGPVLSSLFYDPPVHVASGRGAWLVDADGRRLLDAYNNVASVGHCHPRVTEAVVDQTRRINTHTRYLYEPLIELAERLTGSIPSGHGLDTVMILNSGSEANDLAWRLATSCADAQGALVSDHAYHGMTAAISDLSPQQWPEGHRPSHVETFEVGNDDDALPVSAARGVERAIGLLAARDIAPAAMYIEGAFTSEGVLTPCSEDIREAVRIARDAGALIVADEVQAGHGRTGTHMWSFEKHGYSPDIVTMGKPMGNGYPVAAMVTRSDVVERFGGGRYYFSTFGGNPVAARAAIAVLEVISDELLMERVARVGRSLSEEFARLREQHAVVADVHRHGTLFGVRIAQIDAESASRRAERIVDELRGRGVLIGRTGRRGDVLKIRPPLVFGEREAAVLMATLRDVIGAHA